MAVDLFSLRMNIQTTGAAEAKSALISIGELGTTIGTKLKGLGLAMGEIFAGIAIGSAVGSFLRESIHEAAEAEKSYVNLQVAVRNAGLSYQELKPQLEDITKKVQEQTVFTDEDAREGLGRLIAVTGSLTEAKKLLIIAEDLAATKHISVAEAAMMVGRVYGGNTRALREFGIVTHDSALGLEELGKKLAGAADAAGNTMAGSLIKLQNAWQEVKESVGMFVVRSGLPEFLRNSAREMLTLANAVNTLNEKLRNSRVAHFFGLGLGGEELIPGLSAADQRGAGQRNRGQGLIEITDEQKKAMDKAEKEMQKSAEKMAEHRTKMLTLLLTTPGIDVGSQGLGNPQMPGRLPNEEVFAPQPGSGRGGRADAVNRYFEDILRAGETVKLQFAQLGQNLGMVLANGFAAAITAGIQGKNIFKAFGNVVLQGLGNLMSQMGQALITYGVTMLKLLPFLTNIFTSGPAAIAAGIALTALGSALGGIAHGSGGGGGGGGGGSRNYDQVTNITLTADGAGGFTAPKGSPATVLKVLGKNDPEGQRLFAEYSGTAKRRGL